MVIFYLTEQGINYFTENMHISLCFPYRDTTYTFQWTDQPKGFSLELNSLFLSTYHLNVSKNGMCVAFMCIQTTKKKNIPDLATLRKLHLEIFHLDENIHLSLPSTSGNSEWVKIVHSI